VAATPPARSLRLLRAEGYTAGVVERWLPHQKVRIDLFGVGDLVACKAGVPGPLLVQTTTAGNLAARLKKARAERRLHAWLSSGGRFELHGWTKRGGKWVVRRVQLQCEDLAAVDLTPRPRPRRQRKGERQRGLFET
jgi:hypothetical protein